MSARWPEVGPIDNILVDSSIYLMNIAHDFRNRSKSYLLAKQKAAKSSKDKTVANAPIENPTKGHIYIAKTYPQWQRIVLDTLRKLCSVCGTFSLFCFLIDFLFLFCFLRKMVTTSLTIEPSWQY
jgi:hypothetical protein